jgi:hypothetical protein
MTLAGSHGYAARASPETNTTGESRGSFGASAFTDGSRLGIGIAAAEGRCALFTSVRLC